MGVGRTKFPDKALNQRPATSGEVARDCNEPPALARFKHPSPARGYPVAARALKLRLVLYSHDTMGLGHVRRNLLIAQSLVRSHLRPAILLVAGTRESSAFPMPRGVDCLTLPALYKERDGQYRSRGLNIALHEVISLRASAILGALEAFEPDVLMVDNVPRGAVGELEPALEYMRLRRQARCILGLRDVLDDPEAVRSDWRDKANEQAIRAHYSAIWVYGDPLVYDAVSRYHFSLDVAAKVRYTGYLDPGTRLKLSEDVKLPGDIALPPGRVVLCMVGGGQDGAHLAETFARADLPPGAIGVILTGPFMPVEAQRRLHYQAALQPSLRVLQFVTEPIPLITLADRVIAMGGYNTICELLSLKKHALIVPRVKPRREQLIRAKSLNELGLIDVLHPDQLTPRALTEWLVRDPGPIPQIADRIAFNGLACLPRLLEEVLATPPHPVPSQSHMRIKHVAV